MARPNTVEAQLSVHPSLNITAKALKEKRIDEPFPPNLSLALQLCLDILLKHSEADRNRSGVIPYAKVRYR